MQLLWISLAGAAGTAARYLLSTAVVARLGVPYGTLAVNLIGSFAGGVIFTLAERLDPALRLVLATGFLGGFTTYSAFNTEVLGSAIGGDVRMAIGYLTATVVGCLIAGFAGAAASRSVW